MSFLRGVLTLARVAIEVPGAIAAAERALDDGKGPLGALRAFAAATDGRIDDDLVEQLEDGLRSAIASLEVVTDRLAQVAAQRKAAEAVVDAVLDLIVGVGFQAVQVKHQLRALLGGEAAEE